MGAFPPENSLRDRMETVTSPSNVRSRLGNGSATLLGAKDERSVYVRRMKEIIADHIADLGGIDVTSAAERSLVRRVATMTIQLEKLETRFAEDPTVGERTLDLYNRTAGNLGRLLDKLGMKRRPRDITPTLDEYISERSGR